MKDKLYLKAVIKSKDFEKEMAGLGYPLHCYHLPCFEFEEYGTYVPFYITDEAIKNDYEAIEYAKENDFFYDGYGKEIEAQIAMRKNLRTWVNDDAVLVHYVSEE